MRNQCLGLVLVLAAACGNGGHGESWATKPLKSVADTANGIKFTIDLPDGMQKDKTGSSDIGPRWEAASGDTFTSPSVGVLFEAIPAKTLDDLVKEAEHGKLKASHKQAIDGGMLVTTESPNKGLVYVTVLKLVGDKALTCFASQANNDGIPDFDATKAWLEKICLSLKAT